MNSYGITTVHSYPSSLLRITSKELENMIKEAEEYLVKKYFIQACEKFYKVSEEIVKALAEFYAPETMEKVKEMLAKNQNPWNIYLLNKAATEISNNLSEEEAEEFRRGWQSAFDLHRDCFHEFLLTEVMIFDHIKNIKRMIEISKNMIKEIEKLFSSFKTANFV